MTDVNAIELPRGKDGKSTKEKLRDWYIEKIANNGETFEKIDNISTTVTNAAGSVALSVFAPQLIPFIPAIQKGYKALRKFAYNKGKEAIHKSLDIQEEDLNVKKTPDVLDALSSEEVKDMTQAASDIVMTRGGIR